MAMQWIIILRYILGGGYWNSKLRYNVVGKKVVLGVAAIWDQRKGLPELLPWEPQAVLVN